MDDDVERQAEPLQQWPRDEQDPAGRHRPGCGAGSTIAGEVPQHRQVLAGAPGPERVEDLARQRTAVQPVGVARVGIGAAVLEAQRRRPVEAGGRDDGRGTAQRGQPRGEGFREDLRSGGVGSVDRYS
jgi:hypothetical protein